MTVVIKSYRFDLPPPAFTESNYAKGHWDIIHTTDVDLKDYPDLHECLGCEMIISDRIYDGDHITFKAQYFNNDTGEHIFTSDQTVPDPGDSGYTYWNSYRIASWIGNCHWEVSGPMNIKITVTVKKGIHTIGANQFIMNVIETVIPPPPQGECPDFWEDPIGWTLCTITNGFSVFIEWFSTSFLGFIQSISDWMNTFGANLAIFIRDPVTKIQTWMSGVFVSIGELTNQIATGISDWWKQGIIDVGVMITNATNSFNIWIDDNFSGINAWWENIKTVWGTFWTDAITGLQLWAAEFTINVNNWYTANIQPIIDTINIATINAGAWIAGFPTFIAQWWNDRMIDIGVWLVEATTNFNNFLGDFTGTIGDWWNDRVIDIGVWLADRTNEFNLWVETGLPGIVGNMFEWAKPAIQPIMDAVGFLGQIVGIVTGTATEDPKIAKHKTDVQTERDRINDILGRP